MLKLKPLEQVTNRVIFTKVRKPKGGREKVYYYLDSDGIVRMCHENDEILKSLTILNDPNPMNYLRDILINTTPNDRRNMQAAVHEIGGMITNYDCSYNRIQEYLDYLNAYADKHNTYEGCWLNSPDSPFYDMTIKSMDRVVISVDSIDVIRDPENTNKDTFDMIRVMVVLNSSVNSWDYIKKNQRKFLSYIAKHIANDFEFKKYGVPVNILRCTTVKRATKDILMVVFEPKKLNSEYA